MRKKILAGLLAVNFVFAAGSNVHAATAMGQQRFGDCSEEATYQEEILESDLAAEDKIMLLSNNDFEERYNAMLSDGWVLQDIEVNDCVDTETSSMRTFASSKSTVKTKQGKVVSSSFVQPRTSKKVYNNKLYQKASDAQKYAQISIKMASKIPGGKKIKWVASKLFSLNTSELAPFFNTGTQEIQTDATYYLKDAYYKSGSKYYIGYEVSQLRQSSTIIAYYRNKNNTPKHKSKSRNQTFTSKSYYKNNDDLVKLAKKHYNMWYQEPLNVSSTFTMN